MSIVFHRDVDYLERYEEYVCAQSECVCVTESVCWYVWGRVYMRVCECVCRDWWGGVQVGNGGWSLRGGLGGILNVFVSCSSSSSSFHSSPALCFVSFYFPLTLLRCNSIRSCISPQEYSHICFLDPVVNG